MTSFTVNMYLMYEDKRSINYFRKETLIIISIQTFITNKNTAQNWIKSANAECLTNHENKIPEDHQ